MSGIVPLSTISEGTKCEIADVVAGRGLARRLAELGFIAGTPIRIARSESGAMIININGQRYALSRGIAMKIMVKKC